MKILILGDSNYRNCFVKDKFEQLTKQEIDFKQVSSNETTKAVLEKTKNYDAILASGLYNELAYLTKNVTEDGARDTVIRQLIKEQVAVVEQAANENKEVSYTLIKPLRRKQPEWLTGKSEEINTLYEDEFGEKIRPDNMSMSDCPKFTDSYLGIDGVHLIPEGLKIVQDFLVVAF